MNGHSDQVGIYLTATIKILQTSGKQARGNSKAREGTCTTAATQATVVTTLDP